MAGEEDNSTYEDDGMGGPGAPAPLTQLEVCCFLSDAILVANVQRASTDSQQGTSSSLLMLATTPSSRSRTRRWLVSQVELD